jgi:hypothetical protein
MVERQETAGDEDRLEGALGVGSIGAGGGVGRRRLGAEQLAEVVGQVTLRCPTYGIAELE